MQIEMTIKGLMVDPITNTPIVILRDKEGQKVLPIWVGIFEANAIALQIENIPTPRPMTHDLLRNIIQDLRATVEKIVVCDLQENTFYALIYLGLNGDTVAIDARPSDAIALAVRVAAPIFATEAVLDRASVIPEADEEERLSVFRDFVNSLGLELDPSSGEGGSERGGLSFGPDREQPSDEDGADGGLAKGDDSEPVG